MRPRRPRLDNLANPLRQLLMMFAEYPAHRLTKISQLGGGHEIPRSSRKAIEVHERFSQVIFVDGIRIRLNVALRKDLGVSGGIDRGDMRTTSFELLSNASCPREQIEDRFGAACAQHVSKDGHESSF